MLTNVKTSKYGFRIHSDPNGEYTVNAMRRLLEYKFILYKCLFICWSKLIPLKVRCFIWRTSLGRIPVDNALMVRGNNITNIIFPLCNKESESTDHLLITRDYTREVQDWILKWCGV